MPKKIYGVFGEWTPMNKKKPDVSQIVLISVDGRIALGTFRDDGKRENILSSRHFDNMEEAQDNGRYFSKYWFDCEADYTPYYTIDEVDAWMPLPDPYVNKESRSDKDYHVRFR